jgi:hypothetical protein
MWFVGCKGGFNEHTTNAPTAWAIIGGRNTKTTCVIWLATEPTASLKKSCRHSVRPMPTKSRTGPTFEAHCKY